MQTLFKFIAGYCKCLLKYFQRLEKDGKCYQN